VIIAKDKLKEWQPDSLLDLLIGQCADLEGLLALARRQAIAAEQNDFDELVVVAQDRASLGERLESYHRQIAELRATMGRTAEPVYEDPVVKETVRLAVEIQTLDTRTRKMLAVTRTETRNALVTLEQGRRNFAAYLQGEAGAGGLKCDRRA